MIFSFDASQSHPILDIAAIAVFSSITAFFAFLASKQRATAAIAAASAASKLSELSERASAILACSIDAIVITDHKERIVEFNPAAEKMFSFSRGDVLGKSVADVLIPPAMRQQHHIAFERHCRTGESTILGKLRVFSAMRADGSPIDIELYINRLPGASDPVFAAFIRDVTEQRKLTAGLDRLARIVESSEDAIISKSLDGIVISWNKGATSIFGYDADEMVGQSILRLIPPEARRSETEILSRVRAGESLEHYETVRLRKDGRKIFVSLAVSPIRDSNGKIVGASKIAHDVTEQKRIYEELRTNERRFREMAESLPHLFRTSDANGQVDYANAQWVEFTGRPANEAFGDGWLDFVLPEDREGFLARRARALARGERLDNEFRLRRADGQYRWMKNCIVPLHDASGRVVRWFFSTTDIDDTKTSERRLRDQLGRLSLLHQITRAIGQRQDLRSIFQVVLRVLEDSVSIDFCCVCLSDAARDKLIVSCVGPLSESAAADVALAEQDELPIGNNGLGRCLLGELVYQDEIGKLDYPLTRKLAGAGMSSLVLAPLAVESEVFGILLAARRQMTGFSSGDCEFLRQLSEHVALAMHQAQIYTALQTAYDDLRRTQQAVLEHERLRALGQMASGIAHDINNALSPVALYTEMLLDDEPDLSPRTREYLETTQRAVDDVANTVGRMREFYRDREEQVALSPVMLNPLVEQVLALTRARWSDMPQSRGLVIAVAKELRTGLPDIAGVESEIREALTNLILNAVDAMPEGGKLTLRTGIAASGGSPGSHPGVFLEVKDTGIGMDDATRDRCLEPFFTTKGDRGTGLGLPMVYGMVQRHNAQMEIDSAPGQGTTMRVIFTPKAEESQQAHHAGFRTPRAGLRVLVIDDDPVIIKSLRDSLEAGGQRVVTAGGGAEGIEVFETAHRSARPFDLVITDLGMPHVDGSKVAAAVKKASPGTPLILLTGWGQRLVADDDIPANVDRVLSKPPKLNLLRTAVAELIEHSGRGET